MFMSPKLNQSHDYIDLKTSRGWKLLGKKVWQYKWIYLIMLLPGLAVTFVFKYLTMPGILLSWKTFVPTFGDTSLFGFLESSPWVGWQHFTRLFRESAFWTATGNTLIISLLKLVFGFPFPIILSILINELVFKKYRRVLQTVYTFPHFLSWVVLAGMAINLLGDTGIVKRFAMLFDPSVQDTWNVLYNTRWFRTLLIASDMWKEGGWGTILYFAALTNVNPELYEAAKIDGAGPVARTRAVTLPAMMPVGTFSLIMSLGSILNNDFEQVLMFYNSAVYSVGDIIETWVYRVGLGKMQYSVGSAVSLLKAIISMVLIIGANAFSRKVAGRGMW